MLGRGKLAESFEVGFQGPNQGGGVEREREGGGERKRERRGEREGRRRERGEEERERERKLVDEIS